MHLKAKEVRVLGTIDCQAREVESEENVKCLFWSSRSRRVPHGTERVWLATGDAEFFFLSLSSLFVTTCDAICQRTLTWSCLVAVSME